MAHVASRSDLRPFPILANGGLLLAVFAASLAVVNSVMLTEHPDALGVAVLVDLTLTAGLCHWVFGVRLGGLPLWSVALVVGGGWLVGRWLLPAGVADVGDLPLLLAGAIEILVFMIALVRIVRLAKAFRTARAAGEDWFSSLEAGFLAVAPTLPSLAAWVRFEAELLVLSLTGWFRRCDEPSGAQTFSHHRECNWTAMAGVFVFLSLIEGAVVHLLLMKAGHDTAVLIALGLHVYGVMWIVGDAQAFRLKRTSIRFKDGNDTLDVNVGLRGSASIRLDNIACVEVGEWTKAEDDQAMLRVFGAANVLLRLRQPVEVRVMFRRLPPMSTVLLQLDEPEELADRLRRDKSRTDASME